MYGDSVSRSDLDSLRRDFEYEINYLKDAVSRLERELETERDARREEDRGIWESIGSLRGE